MDQRLADLPAPALLAVAGGLATFGIAGVVLGRVGPTPGPTGVTIAFAAACTPFGVFVMRRRPGHPIGRLMALAGVTAGLAALAVTWSSIPAVAWLSQWMWWPPFALIPVLLLHAPDGRLPSPRWRALRLVLVGSAALATVALAAAAVAEPTTLLTTLDPVSAPPVRILLLVAAAGAVIAFLGAIGVLASLVVRWRRAAPLERGQLACLLPVILLLLLGIVLDEQNVPLGWIPAAVGLPLGLTLAVLRYQLHDLDLHIHRGTVWLVLTSLVIAVYAGVVTALGLLLTGLGPVATSFLGAATVAAVLQPAQALVQRAVRRLLFGRRDEPYRVITRLGSHLRAVRDPLAVLPEIATTVVEELRVPYAAVRVADDDGSTVTVAERGRWAGAPERFPMIANGQDVGELLVAPRRPGTSFSTTEAGLLADLAGQAALAAQACRAALSLRRARDQLVLAREEERRRIRRDLHDGVASGLVGTRMLTAAIRQTLPPDAPAQSLLDVLSGDLDDCTAGIRELIDGLRPAALDDGLEKALLGLVERFGGHGLAVRLDVADDLTELTAAVEVVAFRVVSEALTNVVKHSGATNAAVRVRRNTRHLDVLVVDDGAGFTEPGVSTGVGLPSMRSRVEEIGGRCEIVSGAAGTTVGVLLPLDG